MVDFKIILPKKELKKVRDAFKRGDKKVEVKVEYKNILMGKSSFRMPTKMLEALSKAYSEKSSVKLSFSRTLMKALLLSGGGVGSELTTTSNIDLGSYASKLGIKPFSVINVDDKIRTKKCIYNSATTGEVGKHWLALFIDDKFNYCFDPFGMVPDERILTQLLNLNDNVIVCSTLQIQGLEESNCGQHCILWLNALNKVGINERFEKMEEYCTTAHDVNLEWSKLGLPFNGK